MKRTTEEILAEAITGGKSAMEGVVLALHDDIDALDEAGKAGFELGKTLREYAVSALREGE